MSVPKQEECEPIAIVGLGCRLPGAASPRALWELLLARGDAVGVLDAESADGRTPSEQRTIRGGFLEHIDRFDASFFGISPREAERLDPQHRILLEVVWEALEDAGLAADRLNGSATGVFVGMWINDYESRMFSESGNIDFHMTTGSGRYTASGRLSNLLDLRGPSLTIDSACSSSLVAVHLACQSLRSGEISLAIVGGVNVILQPHISSAYSQAGMLSPDGRCKFGDARADGYVRSEGVGVVVLKPLGRAREDRDPIHAVILGTAVNNDGRTGYSLGTPGRAGQEDLLRTAYSRAGVAPALVQYVEAHGTGTRAGDPVELAALGAVLGAGRNAKRPCFVGSVKTNIGHTEGAAGLAGLIKVALSLEHRTIPASLHFETPTPEVAWDELALAIPTEALAWPETDRPVAGVSSFGIGGTNAHAVLAAAPIDAASPVDDGVKRESLLVVSARSSDALRGLAEGYCEHLADPDLPALSDICYTAAVRRTHHEHRLAVIGRDPQEITARLQSLLKASSPGRRVRVDGRSLRVAFVFPGQGSQWVGMGRRLAQKEPAFRKAFERCAAAVAAHGGPALIEELNTDEPSRLERVDVVQPALFAVQVALAELWREWGVEPVAVVGHSMGEVAAAHVAGALTLDDAARVISTRSALLRRISGRGAMVMVELSPDELGPVLRGRENQLSIAVCNSPRSTVVAGDVDALDALIEQLGRDGVLCRRVKVDVASHSPQVEPLRDDLLRGLTGLTPLPSRVPMYSTVTGAPIDGAQLDPGYWIKNLRETVKFSTAVRRLLEDECDVFVEISPHPILLAAIEQNAGAGRSDLFLPSLRRQEPERAVMLESLGALYVHGYPVDWARLYPSGGYCVGLPSYPWKRQRFWYPTSPTGGRRTLETGRHPLVEEHITSSADPGTHFWQGTTDPVRVPWLMEYRVDGLAQLPASAIVEMALAAGRTLYSAGGCRVEDVCLESPLVVSEAAPRIMQLVVSASVPGSGTFRFASRDAGAEASARWTVHATGTIRTDPAEDETTPSVAEPAVMTDAEPAEDHYEAMRRRGLDYGPSFHGLVETARRGAVTFVRLRATETVRREAGEYEIHPCLLDACLQAVVAGLVASPRGKNITYVPARIGRVILHGRPSGEEDLWCRVAVRAETPDGEIVADIVVADGKDHILIEVTNIRLAPLVRKPGDDLANQVFEIAWRPKSRLASGRSRNAGRWVILADRRGAGEALAGQLAAHGARCSLIFGRGVQLGAGRAAAASDPTRLGEYEALVASSSADPIEGVVYLWGLDTPPLDLEPQAAEAVTEALAVQGLVHLVKALVPSETRPPRIVLATAGTQDVAGGPGRVAIEQAPLWGVGAVIASEYPDLRCVRVDLSAEPTVEEIEGLAGECQEPDGEGQIALRGPSRFVARLGRVVPSAADHVEEQRSAPAGETPFRVHASSAGALGGLHLRPLERRAPGPGEVEIEVHAAGLNFRDVMSALGSLPGLFNGVGSMGIECSGRVVAVGERVETLNRGDEVVAIAFGSLGTHVVADARLVARKPLTLSHQVAATLPIAFVTAWYALHTLAGMRPGERVLIHAASGGVGLAAVQLARKAGAHVFATVGSPRKHEFLRALGVEQVFDSRSLSFAENVRARTGGEGVDIVLNSLAGPAITAGLMTLAPYGRFVELGTRDIHQNSPLGLGPFRSNLSYAALDLVQMCRERPEVVGALLADMMQRFSDGDLEPLPVHMFPIAEVREAFRYMAEARHIGKIGLSLLPEEARVAPLVGAPAAVRAEATYLITGGLGALGLAVAGALVDAGARHMVLIGRRAPSEAARRAIAELTRKGVDVVTMEADVTSPERMAGVLETLRREKPPLRGVIHAAGVLDDATLLRLTRDQIRTVMAPKAAGAYMLHVLTRRDPLDFFVLFSSTSALLGLGGQANYAAANAFLDALARHRHRLGQTALSIGWGPWSDIGLAAVSDERGKRLEALGLGSLTPQQGAEAFTRALGNSRAHVAVMEFDAAAWCGGRGGAADVFFEELSAPTPSVAGDERSPSLAEALRVAPAMAREDMLLRHVREQVASVLRFAEPEAIDVARGFFTLGMDSLMAIELRNRLQAALERSLPSTVVFDRPSITQLAGYLGREILGWETSPVAAGAPEPDAVDAEEIRRLPRHELRALLAEELKQLKDLG